MIIDDENRQIYCPTQVSYLMGKPVRNASFPQLYSIAISRFELKSYDREAGQLRTAFPSINQLNSAKFPTIFGIFLFVIYTVALFCSLVNYCIVTARQETKEKKTIENKNNRRPLFNKTIRKTTTKSGGRPR